MTQPKGTPRYIFMAKCTAVGGGNSTLVPEKPDEEIATSIVVNGNAEFVVNDQYLVEIRRR